jgi:eukaryotic-like serine/threonine-protein kinase
MMPTPANGPAIDILERGQILTPPQLEEVKRVLQQRLPDPKTLTQELLHRGWLTAYQARELGSGRGAGLVLDNYLLLEPLGIGGSGQVFKARHRKMGRLVALKVLRPDVVKDREIVQRFYREIEVASQLSHPNIVLAYEAGPIGGSLVLIMEFVEGTDLERLVQQSGPLPVPRACNYIRQAAVGLQYAHERGLVHRDIKPSNLLVAKPGPGKTQLGNIIKILDLGLARLQQPVRGSRTANLTVLAGNSVMQGTPDYMAPEQALDFHNADNRSDIYSLGCTFYFLLAGQPPFPGGTLAEKLLKHQMGQARPIEELRNDVPPAVAEVLRRMLAKQPADRYAAAGDIAAALSPFAQPGTLGRTLPDEGNSTLWDKPFDRKEVPPPEAPVRP